MSRRWTLPLFLLVAALHIAPVWSVRYLPTGDGPAHVYNAWVLHELASGTAPPNIAGAYRIDLSPHPNWTGHALMALAMIVIPPLVAEKLLVTLVLVALFAGAWMLATAVDPRSDVHAFFVFPFAWAQTLVAGYYNFSLSVGLFLLVVATWWRRRQRPWPGTAAILALLLLACYFTHPLAALFACGAVGLLSLLERRLPLLLALVPATLLLFLFGSAEQSNVGKALDLHVAWDAARILGTAEVVQSLDAGRQRPVSIAVAVFVAVLSVVTLLRDRRKPANGLALVALFLIASMFWLPAASGTRDLFTQRTAQFVFPLLAAWLTPRLSGRARAALVAVLTLLAIANLAVVWRHVRAGGADDARYVAKFRGVEPETSILPLFFRPEESGTVVDLFRHRLGYVSLEKRLVDYRNYEPGSGYFPVAWRAKGIDTSAVELAPATIDIAAWAGRAEYVVTTGLVVQSQQYRDLQQRYVLVRVSDELRIWRRKAPLRGTFERILLPLLGTRSDVGAPGGARWRVDQRIVNRSPAPLRIVFQNCLDDIPCDLLLGAREMVPVAAADRRFVFLLVPKGASEQLQIETAVRRADIDRPELTMSIPAVHERAFRSGTVTIPNIPATSRKIGLRLYLLGESVHAEVAIRLRSHASGAVVGERKLEPGPFFENANLVTDFGDFTSRADAVDLEIDVPPGVRAWAFATSADENGQTLVRLPASGTGFVGR